jgi:hypothetical protein
MLGGWQLGPLLVRDLAHAARATADARADLERISRSPSVIVRARAPSGCAARASSS